MKKNRFKLFSISLLVILSILGVFYLVQINKLELHLLNEDLNYEAYTFVSEKELFEKVDQDQSNYENLSIYVTNDEFEEFNIEEQLQSLYDSFNLKLKDSTLIPLGKDVKVRYEATKSKSLEEIVISKSLNHKAEIEVFDDKKKELESKPSFVIAFNGDLDKVLNFKAYIVKFGQLAEEVPLTFDDSVDNKKAGKYKVKLINKDYNFEKEIEVIVEKEIIVIIEKKPDPIIEKSGSVAKVTAKQAGSLDRIDILVNKEYHLSANAVPTLKAIPSNYAVDANKYAQPAAVDSFIKLVNTMQEETGMIVLVSSAYRSYSTQDYLFNSYAARDGVVAASRYSARPGQSEHQTGLALDVSRPGASIIGFGGTQESVWVAQNAHRFGFIIRYPQGKEHITGYQYEPWHLRYLGIDLATKVKNSNSTFDEYWLKHLR